MLKPSDSWLAFRLCSACEVIWDQSKLPIPLIVKVQFSLLKISKNHFGVQWQQPDVFQIGLPHQK